MTESQTDAAGLISWLVEQGLKDHDREALLQGYCQQLLRCGLPLHRCHVAQRAFHPRFGGIAFSWTRDDGLSHEHFTITETPPADWLRSPFYQILQNGMAAFHSRMSPEDREKYPLLEELAANGVSEYLATGVEFGESQTDLSDPEVPNEGFMISWAADGPDGFSEAQRALLRQTVPYLGLALKSAANRRMATDLLRVYLGRDAGRRVLSGEIQRGSSREIDAVICYFDLKNFTNLAEQIPGPELIDMLNDYFGIAVAVFQSHGGNILKFMGDGILSMFDLGSIGEDARAGLDAVLALKRQLEQRNVERAAEGLPIADFTLALHAGEILYGNIGAENRLDFTVIGPTVNLTSRISGMHRSVGQSIILSEEVRRAAQPTPHDLVSLGRYMLRGVSEPIELFTIYEGGRR